MRFPLFVLIVLQLCACRPKPRPIQEDKREQQEMSLLAWNQHVLENEIRTIEAFLDKNAIDYQQTETGLYLYNMLEGSGEKAQKGNMVWVEYKVYLLDGTLCEQTDSLRPENFILGKNRKPVGLNQTIELMHEGGSTHVIIPHYLLHGIAGDGGSIPPITPAIFELRLVKVEKR